MKLLKFLNSIPPRHPHGALLIPLMQRAIDCGFDRYFRVGQSMFEILFSTLDHHGIRDESHVRVNVEPPTKLQIAFHHQRNTRDPATLHSVEATDAFPTLTRHLQRLWMETQPEPLPEELRRPENYL